MFRLTHLVILCLLVGSVSAQEPVQPGPPPSIPQPVIKDEEHFLKITKAIALRGLVHIRYQQFEDSTKISGFDLRRARLELKGDVAAHIGFRLHVEMAESPKTWDATFNYTFNEHLVLTAGQSKTPYCYDNTYSPWNLPTITRTQLDEALCFRERDLYGNQNGRDIGVWASGKFSTAAKRPLIEYTLGMYNGSGINRSDDNNDKDLGAALRFSPMKDLWVAGRYYTGMTMLVGSTRHRERVGGEVSFKRDRYLAEGEFLYGTDGALERDGYYGTLGYFIVKDKFQFIARYDTYDPNTFMSSDASVRYVAAANWFFNTNTRIMVEADIVGEEGTQLANNVYAIQFQAAF